MREAYETGPGAAPIAEIDTGAAVASRSMAELFWRRFREDRLAMASLIFLALLVIVAIAAPLVVKTRGRPGPTSATPSALDPFFAHPDRARAPRTSSASTSSAATSSAAPSMAPGSR